jgi:hypothetical protein
MSKASIPSDKVVAAESYDETVFLRLDAEQVAYYLNRMLKDARKQSKDDSTKLYLSVSKSCHRCKHQGNDPHTTGENGFEPYCFKHRHESLWNDKNKGYCDDFELNEGMFTSL